MADSSNKLPDGLALVFDYMVQHKSLLSDANLIFPVLPDDTIVWRGFAREIAEHLSLHINSVYRLLAHLQILGSINRLKHGSNSTPSTYHLIKPPDDYEYLLMRERSVFDGKITLPSQKDRLWDSLNRMASRLDALEEKVARLEGK